MNVSFFLVVFLSLASCLYCKRHRMLSSSIVDAVASALDDDFPSAEKVITLNGQPSQKMLAYSTSSYPQFKDMKAWANYHKESGRIDSILGKCYECIRDRNNKGRRLNTKNYWDHIFSPYSNFRIF